MRRARASQAFIQIVILALAVTGVAGCKKGRVNKGSTAPVITLHQEEVLDYSDSLVRVKVAGEIIKSAAVDLDRLNFFDDRKCQSSIRGSVLVREFAPTGAILEIPIDEDISIYASTSNSPECHFVTSIKGELLQPESPTFQRTSPASPTRASFKPGIFGSAFPPTSTVRFFDDEACTNEVGQGVGADLSVYGIGLELSANTTSHIHGRTEDLRGQVSPCVFLAEYRHSNMIISAPVFVSTTPLSPNNSSSSPKVRGTVVPGVVWVGLYSDSACSIQIAEGTGADYQSAGFQIDVTPGSQTSIYAKAIDDLGNPSNCVLQTTYIHDITSPEPPVYLAASPTSPTRLTRFPRIIGDAPSDAVQIQFFDNPLCLIPIGSGSLNSFRTSGVSVSVAENQITSVYGQSVDGAGNISECVYLTDYKHNTIPPNPPTYLGSTPESPNNQSTSPLLYGQPALNTVALSFFNDEECENLVGAGPVEDFMDEGIEVNLEANKNSSVYVQVSDLEGNISNCSFFANYDHSVQPAPSPGFFFALPASPTRISTQPYLIGTANSIVTQVKVFDDPACSNQLGSGTRAQFTSSGISVSVSANSTTDFYAVSTDVYGNDSACTFLTTYIHNSIPPNDPIFDDVTPETPNSHTTNPTLTGNVSQDPASQLPPSRVAFYDSFICVSKLGEGDPLDFSATGIQINVARNAVTTIYARAFDDAGNMSGCVHMLDYTHNDLKPAHPIFLSATPATPSFSRNTKIIGTYGQSTDFMNKVAVGIFSDSQCTAELTSGSPEVYQTTGIPVVVPDNATTQLYAASVNEVGTLSTCTPQVNFRHYDLPPQNLSASNQTDGSVSVTWIPDTVSRAPVSYTLERSINSTGPFSVIATGLMSNTFRDALVSNDTTYYYRVYATNSTGRSQYSSAATVTTSAPAPVAAASLTAQAGDEAVTLSWSGFPQNMSYKLYRSLQKGGPYALLPAEPQTTSYVDYSVTNGVDYYYVVTGTNPAGESATSNIASARPLTQPQAPSNLQMDLVVSEPQCGGSSGVRLAWAAPPYFDSFQILRGSGFNNKTVIASTSETTYVLCNLDSDRAHHFAIRARWGVGTTSESETKSFYYTSGPGLTVYPGEEKFVLSWTVPSGGIYTQQYETKFNVYRAQSANGPFTEILSDYNGTAYTDTSAALGDAYFYYVQAYVLDQQDRQIFIGWPSLVRSGISLAAPSPPTQLKLTVDANQSLRLNWSAPSHYNGFNVYWSPTLGGPYSRIHFATSTTAVASSVEGMNYYYVTAHWGDTETAPTNTVSFRSGKPLGLIAQTSATEIELTWNPVGDADGYKILRATGFSGPYSQVDFVTSATYSDTNAAAGVGYYYKVIATFADGTEGQPAGPVSSMLTGTNKPAGLTTAALSQDSVIVRWVGVPGVTEYEVSLATSIAGPYTKRGETPIHEFIIGGLSFGTEYFVRVAALVGGDWHYSDPISVYTFPIVAPPVGSVGDGVINLTWTPLTDIVSYSVLRSEDGVQFTNVASSLPLASYSDLLVNNGQIYFYRVQAHFAHGVVESENSLGYTAGEVPNMPVGLAAQANGTGTEVILSWARVDGATRYNVYQATSAAGPFTVPIFSTTSYSNVQVTGLNKGSVYYFKVSALNGTLESNLSSAVGILSEENFDPPVPIINDPTSILISWDPVASADLYDLYRSTDASRFERVASDLAAAQFIDSTIDPTITYYYKFHPKTAAGVHFPDSDVSNGVNISTVPMTPTGFELNATATNAVDLSWNSVPNITHYEVYRSTVSGGPYTLIDEVASGILSYTDGTVTPGQTYFYILRSRNRSGVTSLDSNELGIRLIAAPANLATADTEGGVELNWDSVAGASSYRIRRSDITGGPYGEIGTAAGTTYLDSDVEADLTYFYVVEAVFPDGAISPRSQEASRTRGGTMDLVVPIELTDSRLGSSASQDVSFARTATSLDTAFYDGTVTYEFEITAANEDSAARSVHLVDGQGDSVAELVVPSGTTNFVRMKTAFTPNTGLDSYRLRLQQTSALLGLKVASARILVKQQDATRTRLYFPLFSSEADFSELDQEAAIFSTQAQTYSEVLRSIPFIRDTASLSRRADYNAWELEVLVATDEDTTGTFSFKNKSTGVTVGMTETRFSGDQILMASVPIDDGVVGFGTGDEGATYRLQVRCDENCADGQVSVYKAGLWVTLEKLSKAKVFYRNSLAQGDISVQTDFMDERTFLDLSDFSNPEIYFQAEVTDTGGTSAQVELVAHSNDSGGGGLATVAGSTLALDGDTRQTLIVPAALTVNSGERFLTRILPSGTVNFHHSAIIIKTSSP